MTGNGKHNELPENEQPQDEFADVAAEFAEVGRKLRDAVVSAWNSQERHRLEQDIRDGLNRLTDEVNEAVKSLRESEAAQHVETRTQQVREDLETGKVSDDVRKGLVKALRGLSEALDRMANSFTPLEDDQSSKK